MDMIDLEKLAETLTKAIIDTGVKDNCRISPEFKKAFIDDIRGRGYHENLVTLVEHIIDN